MKLMKILAIGAHPDDIEFGCGGTLFKYTAKGHQAFLMIMTKGDEGGEPEVRIAEQEASQSILGIDRIYWSDYQDTKLVVDKEMINKIEAVIADVDPDFILTHFPYDTHQDHRHLAQATISATRYIKNVMFFEGPTTQNFTPNVYVDISEALDTKIDALTAHHSQMEKTNIEDMSIVELARSTANFRGIQGRVKYAEAFTSLRLFINV